MVGELPDKEQPDNIMLMNEISVIFTNSFFVKVIKTSEDSISTGWFSIRKWRQTKSELPSWNQ